MARLRRVDAGKRVARIKTPVSKKPIPQKELVITPKEIQKPEEINNDSVVIEKVETTPPPVEENTPVEIVEANLSSQENENTPVVNLDTTGMLGTDKKSLKRAAVRNYDNHHIRLSNRKGGLKPSGKKPLW